MHVSMSGEWGGGGLRHLWFLMFSHEVLSEQNGINWQWCCHGAAVSHLTSKMQVTCATLHHAAKDELQGSTPCKQFDHLARSHGE